VDILSGSESIFSTRYQDQDPPDTLKAFFQYFTKKFQMYSIPGSSWYRSFKNDPIPESGWYESSIKYPNSRDQARMLKSSY